MNNLLTLVLFQTCMTFFCRTQNNMKNIIAFILNESHTGLEDYAFYGWIQFSSVKIHTMSSETQH